LKHRGITDQEKRADKNEASGHKTDGMIDLYNHEVAVVEPAGRAKQREFYREFYRGGIFVVASKS
jgi:hypothetical protein